MSKVINKLSIIIAFLFLVLSFNACGGNAEINPPQNPDSGNQENIKEKKYTLIENNASNYVLVVPDTLLGNELVAANNIAEILSQSSGYSLPVCKEEDYTAYPGKKLSV